jgi:stage II sporulation protein D
MTSVTPIRYLIATPSRYVATLSIAFMVALGGASAKAASVFYIDGGGNGHGVGMSQYGAYGYALHGASYQFILAHYFQGTVLRPTNPNQIVRVLLRTGQAAFSGASRAQGVELAGAATPGSAPRPRPPHAASVRLAPAGTYSMTIGAGGGSLVLENPSGRQLARFAAPVTVTGAGALAVSGLGLYRGALELRPDGAGGVQTVDAVDLEDYVRGVVSVEVPASWAPAALEAQAVAARTYAITTDVGGDGYTLYPDTRSQMYRGASAETPSTDAAVSATRGQVVTYSGVPVATYFFASSGGYTENVENAWPGAPPEPWLHGVPDPYDGAGGDPYHRWQYQLTLAAVAAKLGGLVRGSLVGVRVVAHGVSPRIVLAQVVGTKGLTTVTGAALAQLFGLPSTYASFTTISTVAASAPARTPAPSPLPGTGGASPARALLAVAALLRAIFAAAPAPPGLAGSVYPAPRVGVRLSVQQTVRGRGWRTIATTPVGAGGRFAVKLPGTGTYRVVYGGLAGPAVPVG